MSGVTNRSFSIHDWIEGLKTTTPGKSDMQQNCVSVSTTGSKGRKPTRATKPDGSMTSFSIHDWIEGSKTAPVRAGVFRQGAFQYPRLDRRVENTRSPARFTQSNDVSVSTTGSKGRKRNWG